MIDKVMVLKLSIFATRVLLTKVQLANINRGIIRHGTNVYKFNNDKALKAYNKNVKLILSSCVTFGI